MECPSDAAGHVNAKGFEAYETRHAHLHQDGREVAGPVVMVIVVSVCIAVPIIGTLRGDSSSIGSLVVTAAVVRFVIKVASFCGIRFGGGVRPASPKTAD